MLNILQAAKEKILYAGQIVKKNVNILIALLPILSFAIPFIILYNLYPKSFEETWKGRTYYLFFIWLVLLETILSWGELQVSKIKKLKSIRTVGFLVALSSPTIYVFIASFLGLNTALEQLYTQIMGQGFDWFVRFMPLCIEYFVFATIFVATKIIVHGKKGLTDFSIAASLLFAIGTFYIIDNFYPHGLISPLQFPALFTAALAASFLALMGYRTTIWITMDSSYGWMPHLRAQDLNNLRRWAEFGIGWPCAGVESLIIYTITILLFLRKSNIPWGQRAIYFVIGAVITYLINALRIATIFVIAINNGWTPYYNPPEVQRFHEYYGQLYSMTWIIAYPLMIIGSQALRRKIKNQKLLKRL